MAARLNPLPLLRVLDARAQRQHERALVLRRMGLSQEEATRVSMILERRCVSHEIAKPVAA